MHISHDEEVDVLTITLSGAHVPHTKSPEIR